ncbi:MAG: hypothetical protein HN720_02405 [Nitrospinaceae bacterium]|nr:hypothetical protein [Nitrospinaceae bacterium]
MLDAFIEGFFLLFRIDTYFYICIGLALGMFVGAMPGLTTTLTMAILLPVSFKLEPMLGIPFLIGIYKGASTVAAFRPSWWAFREPVHPSPLRSTAPL